MRQGVDLVATMSQGLVMTPRLQQAIKLLQFNHQEMLDHIDEVLLENPTLEATPSESTYDEGLARVQSEASASESSAGSGDGEGAAAESGVDWERVLDQMADRPRGTEMAGGSSLDDLPPIETNLTYGESLAEHLGFQLHMLRCAEGERRVAEQVVNNLDERGWLEVPLTQLADELGVSAEVAQDGLELVWELDPPGCGARSLSECLAIQARF
jgi:RNA polymerase sigma-54 factor